MGSPEEVRTSQGVASKLGGAADRDGVYLGGTLREKQRKTKLEELRKTKVPERSKEQGRSCTGEGVREVAQEPSRPQGI